MEERGKSSRFRSPAAFAVASIASASAYLWVRIPVGREVQHSFANFCANLQMKPQDWPCQVTPARSIAFYLVASLLVWLAVAIPCAVLASTGRRVTAFAPLVVLGVMPVLWGVWAWFTVSGAGSPNVPFIGALDFGSIIGTGGSVRTGFGTVAFDLATVAVPALFVPVRARADAPSWNRGAREVGLLVCAALSVLVIWGARQLNLVPSGPDWLSSTREWFTPAAFMFVFASLLGTTRRWWPWILAPVGILLSLGLPDALLASLSRSEAFGSIGASAPYAAVGLIASLWRPVGDVIARRRVAREPPESRGRVRPSVALSATAAGLLGVTLIMHACDPLGTQIATALPTFLGAREHVQDLRTRMDLHEALAAMESYRADNGTFAGFDAATGRGIDPALEWSEKPWTGIGSPPSVSIAKASGSQATLLAFSTSGSAFCLEEQTGSRPTYGSAALGSGTSPAEAIAAATALCGSTPWNASALKPFPVDSLCAGQIDGAIVMCRAVQRYLRQTLASPS